MKTTIVLLCILPLLLTGCEGFGPIKIGVCHEDTCVNFEIPAAAVKASGKEVQPVQ